MVINVESRASTRRSDSTCGTNIDLLVPQSRSEHEAPAWGQHGEKEYEQQLFSRWTIIKYLWCQRGPHKSDRRWQIAHTITPSLLLLPLQPNEGAIREETKRLTSRKTHKQTRAGIIRGSSTNTGGVFKSGHAHKHLSTHLSLSHTHTRQKKVHFISQFSFTASLLGFLKASSFVYAYNNMSCIFKKD